MPSLVFYEDEGFAGLLPLVYWRSVFELRIGRGTILDRARQILGLPLHGLWTRDWMAKVAGQRCGVPINQPLNESTMLVNGRWIPEEKIDFHSRLR